MNKNIYHKTFVEMACQARVRYKCPECKESGQCNKKRRKDRDKSE
jgi:hypothetical protein